MTVVAPVSADRVIQVAAAEIGVHEDPPKSNKTPYTRWYGITGPWCAMFVSWVLHHAGFPIAVTTPKGFAYCPYGVTYFKQQGAWADKNTKPKRGWIVFFDFPNDGVNRVSHVGIVEGVLADGRIATIEGNTNGAGSRTGGEVMRHRRSVAGGIAGYGIVDYQPTIPTPEPEEPDMLDAADKKWITDELAEVKARIAAIPNGGSFRYAVNDLNWIEITADGELIQTVYFGAWEERILAASIVQAPIEILRDVAGIEGRLDFFATRRDGGRVCLTFDPTAPGGLPGGWSLADVVTAR